MTDRTLISKLVAGSEAIGLRLSSTQVEQLAHYLFHLERWNRTINLTALPLVGYPSATLDRLVFEPLSSASMFPPGPFRWLDFGSGGGSPAIPLRIVLPTASLTMIESRSRKAAFLRDVIRALGLSDTQVVWNRVATLQETEASGSVDIVTIRALRIDDQVAKSIIHVLASSGRVILFGPVDWSLLSGEFVPIAAPKTLSGVTLLQRLAS